MSVFVPVPCCLDYYSFVATLSEVWESYASCSVPFLQDYFGNVWASLVTQLVKNPPAMQETCVRSLGWEDPLEKGKAIFSILAWRSPWTV